MKDEDLLRALRETAREEDRAYETWRSSDEGRAWDAPRTELVGGIVARALASVTTGKENAGTNYPVQATAQARGSSLKRRRATQAFVALVLAVAGVVFVVRAPPGRPLPEYSVAFLSGTEVHVRSQPPGFGPTVVRPSTPFELVLRPATRTKALIGVRAWIVSGPSHVSIPIEAGINAAGVAHVRGVWPAPDRFASGSELVLLVAHPDDLPQDEPLDLSPSRTRQVVRVALQAAAN